jgi:hypothetical protein
MCADGVEIIEQYKVNAAAKLVNYTSELKKAIVLN